MRPRPCAGREGGRAIRRKPFGAWFVVAVAAIAAALADFVVEGITNTGLFGRSGFTDGSNANIVPVVCLGAVFLLRLLYLRVRRALHAGDGAGRADGPARRKLTPAALVLRLGAIFAVQIAALWTMETIEQFYVVGHGFGGTVWLGGPAALSLAVHAMICVVTAFSARSLLRILEPRALRLIRALLAVLGTIGNDSRPHFSPGLEPVIVLPYFVLCRIGVRAPPAAAS